MTTKKAAALKNADIDLKLTIEDQAGKNVRLQMGDVAAILPKKKLLRVIFNEILGGELSPTAHFSARLGGQSSLIHMPPALGEYWEGQGGDYVGTVFNPDGADYYLIVGPEYDGKDKWKALLDWAKGLNLSGHKDFDLPNRREGRFLQCNAKHLFKEEYYWLSEQSAGISDYAWAQGFAGGSQGLWRKDDASRARAVRRVPI